jgi:hypothetical protein
MQDDEESYLKHYIIHLSKRYLDARIIEAMRRYDHPQNVQISKTKPRQQKFIRDVFLIFAQGSKETYNDRWIDYVMFKQLLVLSGLTPSIEF